MRASRTEPRHRRGSLDVVGVGIASIGQTTLEAVACIRAADRLLYVVNDPITEVWLKELNASAQSMSRHYGPTKDRLDTYIDMARDMVAAVVAGHRVCAVFYGHPGVFVQASHAAIAHLRKRGYRARMLPGVSADAHLFADLGLNPGDTGIQGFEATDFLLSRRRIDPTSGLLLWQVGVLGESTASVDEPAAMKRRRMLVQYLRRSYPARHRVVLYQAPKFPGITPSVKRVSLERLALTRLTPLTTLYVPPRPQRPVDRRVRQQFGGTW